MEYWENERKLAAEQTWPIYRLSRHIASGLKVKDVNFRQTIEIAITEFIIENKLEFREYVEPTTDTGVTDESVADSGETGK